MRAKRPYRDDDWLAVQTAFEIINQIRMYIFYQVLLYYKLNSKLNLYLSMSHKKLYRC